MKCLELFSGTQSVGKVLKEENYEVISVDIEDYKGQFIPTHKCSILDFDYKQYPVGYFDCIWASPPCRYYSKLQEIFHQKRLTKDGLELLRVGADELVSKTLEIIDYFKPTLWFMENPQSGCLKNRDVVKSLPFYDVDYCRYANWGYRKRTRIFTNKKNFVPKLCNKKCGSMIGNKHKLIFCGDKTERTQGGLSSTLLRYRIPPNLISELILSSSQV